MHSGEHSGLVVGLALEPHRDACMPNSLGTCHAWADLAIVAVGCMALGDFGDGGTIFGFVGS